MARPTQLSLSIAMLIVSSSRCYSGVCSIEIDEMRDRITIALESAAETGPSADQTSAATRHRQPTPRSIVTAEVGLEDLSPETARMLADSMVSGHRANVSGDRAPFAKALGDARRAIGR